MKQKKQLNKMYFNEWHPTSSIEMTEITVQKKQFKDHNVTKYFANMNDIMIRFKFLPQEI